MPKGFLTILSLLPRFLLRPLKSRIGEHLTNSDQAKIDLTPNFHSLLYLKFVIVRQLAFGQLYLVYNKLMAFRGSVVENCFVELRSCHASSSLKPQMKRFSECRRSCFRWFSAYVNLVIARSACSEAVHSPSENFRAPHWEAICRDRTLRHC